MTENVHIYIIYILDTNVMIRLHKQRENTLYKVDNNDISLSVNKSFRSNFFFGMRCIIACFHVLGSFLFISIMVNNVKISLPYSPQFAFMSSHVIIIIIIIIIIVTIFAIAGLGSNFVVAETDAFQSKAQAYSEPSQTSWLELSACIDNGMSSWIILIGSCT